MSFTWVYGNDFGMKQIMVSRFMHKYPNLTRVHLDDMDNEVELIKQIKSVQLFDENPTYLLVNGEHLSNKFNETKYSSSVNILIISLKKPIKKHSDFNYIEVSLPDKNNLSNWMEKIFANSNINLEVKSIRYLYSNIQNRPENLYNIVGKLLAVDVYEPSHQQILALCNKEFELYKPWDIARSVEGKFNYSNDYSSVDLNLLHSYFQNRYLNALVISENDTISPTLQNFQKEELIKLNARFTRSTLTKAVKFTYEWDRYVKIASSSAIFPKLYLANLHSIFLVK